jgi:hypothetical protein
MSDWRSKQLFVRYGLFLFGQGTASLDGGKQSDASERRDSWWLVKVGGRDNVGNEPLD